MGSITLALSAAVLALPCEYHIDCSGWDGKATTEFAFRMTAWDGAVCGTTALLFPGSDAETARGQVLITLRMARWRTREVGKTVLVIEGSKKGAIRSVEITGDGWKPAVRWVPLPPAPKK